MTEHANLPHCLIIALAKHGESLMRHPFDLNIEELSNLQIDEVAQLSDAQAAAIQGGSYPVSHTLTAVGPHESGESGGGVSTAALGEEGGHYEIPAIPFSGGSLPLPYPSPDEPSATTLALGEEGG